MFLLVYSFFFPTSQCRMGSTISAWAPWMRSKRGWSKEQTSAGKETDRESAEEKKGAVSCGWHPDRLVWVRNGFPEAPERSRQCHYSNATAWQTACSVCALTNACCQAGTCHGQTHARTHAHTHSQTQPDRAMNLTCTFYVPINEHG